MDTSSASPSQHIRGPAVPTSHSRAVQRPLGIDDVRITGGPFGRWQRINREASIPLGMSQMEKAGSLPNLRLAAGEEEGEFVGPRFQDSDVYKQLEAVSWENGREAAPELAAFVRDTAEILAKVQGPDGYLNSYYQVVHPEKRYAELEFSHEMYCAGHLFQAAVAAARTGGDRKLLDVAIRFADHLVEEFLVNKRVGIDGHPEVETALVELYRVTGERPYLELAEKLINDRGNGWASSRGMGLVYLQEHKPVREAETAVGHAVRQLYLESGILDVYLETGDRSLLECSIRRWEDMVATKTAITGGHGSRHSHEAFGDRYELPPDRAYNESCAAIASIHWSWRLLLATGESRYADLIERTVYNAFAASTSADGKSFFYVNPLQRRADHLEGDDPGRRRGWYSCACCPPNIMRLVATWGHYVATTAGDRLAVQQYAPGTIRAPLDGGTASLTVATEYPWDGTVSLTVTETPSTPWELALRVPEWSRTTTVSVNGENLTAEPDPKGYLVLGREWRAGDVVTLELDMTPRLVHPHHRIDAVRGSVALERGPLVYCFEQVDQTDGVEVDDLVLLPDAELHTEKAELPGVGPTVLIRTDALAVSQPPSRGLPYTTTPARELATTRRTTATAVPYYQWDNRDGGPMRVWLPVAS